jgi:dTDP-4-dehydrorhamnose 3,5-epimerase
VAGNLKIAPQKIPDVLVLEPRRFGDPRGFFSETYSRKTFLENGLSYDFVQDNVSLSAARGTVRGLHFQGPPSEQTKLVCVLQGAILDVAVDIRVGSPTFGQHVAVELTSENGLQLLVPRGFAHGLCTLIPNTVVQYKVDGFYDTHRDFGLRWNDPELGIHWPVTEAEAILTIKDQQHPFLSDLPKYFVYQE